MPEEIIMHEIRLSGKAYKYLLLSFSITNLIKDPVLNDESISLLSAHLETIDELPFNEIAEVVEEIIKAMPVKRPHLWGDPRTTTYWGKDKKGI